MKFSMETAISCFVAVMVAMIVYEKLISPMLEKTAGYEEDV